MSFYVILPSNTAVEGNKTNSFRVRFPRKLEFHSDWSVGLAVFVYPHTWPSLGATGELEFIRVRWNNNILLECQLAPTRPANPQELSRRIATSLSESAEQIARRIDSIQQRILEHSAAIWERIERKIEAQKAKIHKAHAMDTNRTKVDGEK